MIFHTHSGSIYEVDAALKRIRRVSNSNGSTPTARQGDSWKTYDHLSPIKVGNSAMIFWLQSDTPLLEGSPAGASPITYTSEVVRIDE